MLLRTKHAPPLQLCTGVEEDILILSKVMQPSWEFVGYALTVASQQSFKLRARSQFPKEGEMPPFSFILCILQQRCYLAQPLPAAHGVPDRKRGFCTIQQVLTDADLTSSSGTSLLITASQ